MLLSVVGCALALPAWGIEPYRASEIQPYQSQSITPYQSQTVKPRKAQTVKPYQAQDITPYQAQEVKPYQAQEVKPSQAQTLQPAAEPRQEPVAPAPAPQPGDNPGNRAPQAGQGGKQASEKKQKANAKALLGVWQTNIPGAVYTTPSGQAGYDILHVSSGVAVGLFKLNANGTYSWNSYGGKKGKWVATADPEYPVEIIDTVENRRWKVGYNAAKATLIIWSGSFWYEGRKAAVK